MSILSCFFLHIFPLLSHRGNENGCEQALWWIMWHCMYFLQSRAIVRTLWSICKSVAYVIIYILMNMDSGVCGVWVSTSLAASVETSSATATASTATSSTASEARF